MESQRRGLGLGFSGVATGGFRTVFEIIDVQFQGSIGGPPPTERAPINPMML